MGRWRCADPCGFSNPKAAGFCGKCGLPRGGDDGDAGDASESGRAVRPPRPRQRSASRPGQAA
eukprot:12837631-Alexandrium_andersonii.AAC.1